MRIMISGLRNPRTVQPITSIQIYSMGSNGGVIDWSNLTLVTPTPAGYPSSYIRAFNLSTV